MIASGGWGRSSTWRGHRGGRADAVLAASVYTWPQDHRRGEAVPSRAHEIDCERGTGSTSWHGTDGLAPAGAQDAARGEVLMLAGMKGRLRRTVDRGRGGWSVERRWAKGETSGTPARAEVRLIARPTRCGLQNREGCRCTRPAPLLLTSSEGRGQRRRWVAQTRGRGVGPMVSGTFSSGAGDDATARGAGSSSVASLHAKGSTRSEKGRRGGCRDGVTERGRVDRARDRGPLVPLPRHALVAWRCRGRGPRRARAARRPLRHR